MDLTSVKYQDSCIFIEIDSSQGERDGKSLLERARNVYAIYKIIAFGNFVKDTIIIKKRDLSESEGLLTLKFELNQLHHPEQSKIEITRLKFNFTNNESEELQVNRVYSFLDIREPMGDASKDKRKNKKRSNSPNIGEAHQIKKRLRSTFLSEEKILMLK